MTHVGIILSSIFIVFLIMIVHCGPGLLIFARNSNKRKVLEIYLSIEYNYMYFNMNNVL